MIKTISFISILIEIYFTLVYTWVLLNIWSEQQIFAFVVARHLALVDQAEPRPRAIFMKLFFCHRPPSWIWPSRASTPCNIHEVIVLSPPSILDLTKQSLDPVQYSWSYSFVTALHLEFHHVEPRPCAIFMKLLFCHGPPSWISPQEPRPCAIFMKLFFCRGPPSWISPRRASTLCNIHEVILLSRPSILNFTT